MIGSKVANRRTDIFSFGCVLYEMLAGRPAFDGEDVADILSRVLQRDPNWTLLPTRIPERIRELLRLCLERNARNRRSDATDVRLDIEHALTVQAAAAHSNVPTRRVRLLALVAACSATIIILALAVPATRHLRESPPPSPLETRTDIVTPATTDPVSFAISPDGRQIVFVASGDGASRLWLRPLEKTTAQPLPGTENASLPFWSPDNRSVGFFTGSTLKRLDLAGGSPQMLTNAANRGGTWSPDGIVLFTPTTGSPLFRISASGGEPVAVTKLEKQTTHRFPQFLPGGRQFLFYAQGTPDSRGIYLGSLDSPETKRLTVADATGGYNPAGWLLFIRGGTLLAQRLDLMRRELTGDPVTVADPVVIDVNTSGGAVSVSAAGQVAYRLGGANRRQLTWFDRTGKTLGTMGALDENGLLSVRLSPDGRRAALMRTVQGNTDIWLLDADRATRFTFDPSSDQFPIWSPDGSRIVFNSLRKGHQDLYEKPSSGAGSEELLVESLQDKFATDWSADGRFILYHSIDSKTLQDIWVKPLEADGKPFVFLKTPFDERRAQFSPDWRWVAYQSDESGRIEIYVRPFLGQSSPHIPDGKGGQWQVSTAGGTSPRWERGGKELHYIGPDGTLMAVPIAVNGGSFEPGRPVALFRTGIVGGGTDLGGGTNYDIARDGHILINTVLDDAASPITLIQNWKPPAN